MNTLSIRELRQELAERCRPPLTQKDLARKLGVSLSYLNEILNGRRLPGPKMLAAMGLSRQTLYVSKRRK